MCLRVSIILPPPLAPAPGSSVWPPHCTASAGRRRCGGPSPSPPYGLRAAHRWWTSSPWWPPPVWGGGTTFCIHLFASFFLNLDCVPHAQLKFPTHLTLDKNLRCANPATICRIHGLNARRPFTHRRSVGESHCHRGAAPPPCVGGRRAPRAHRRSPGPGGGGAVHSVGPSLPFPSYAFRRAVMVHALQLRSKGPSSDRRHHWGEG